jgi:hypothetical protein
MEVAVYIIAGIAVLYLVVRFGLTWLFPPPTQ